jgi:soluble lytic murein transglycosylase
MMPRIIFGFVFVVWAAGMAPSDALARVADAEQYRQDYLAALDALKRGQRARFQQLSESLDGYVLHGYVQYEFLKNRVDSTPATVIRKFLEDNADAPIAELMRRKWLQHLANRGNWESFLADYRDIDDPKLQCLRLQRLLRTSVQQAALMSEIEALWHTGRRLPSACDPVFAAWRTAGHMTSDRIWDRIRLAMESRRLSVAGELARYLEPRERVWVSRWQAMHRNPVRELNRIGYPVETPAARMIIKHGIVRLGQRDPERAMQQWEHLKEKYQFFGEDENYVLRHLGIMAAQDHLPIALQWLSAVSADSNDEYLHLWRVKAALRVGEWETAKRFIAALPEEAKQKHQWRYWEARTAQATGDNRGAAAMYAALARERSYYGFLAADRVDADYAMQHVSVDARPEELGAMLARPGIQMARELYDLGLIVDARRQWNWTARNMNNRELQVAAVIAREWGWYDRAILTVSKSDHLDDLELRFPILYRDVIEANAAEYGIDPSWIFGVVRQESAFVVDARSHAGALGLMQLMPATGRLTGRRLKMRIGSNQALLNVENNLRLGASYLKHVLDRNDGHQVLATAAYNAGPSRVPRWLPPDGSLDSDVWIETIPFDETRDYIRNVLAFTAVYEHRLSVRPTRLRTRMPAVDSAQ